MKKERAFLSLGGNLGDPVRAMRQALAALDDDAETKVVAVSSLYRTPPWGKTDQPDFLNAAAELSTSRTARGLLELCLATEHRLKRVRAERWGPRLIDMDILAVGQQRVEEVGLVVPHPRMLERAFVLLPLAEIAPRFRIAGETVAAHLRRVDTKGIEAVSGPDWWQ